MSLSRRASRGAGRRGVFVCDPYGSAKTGRRRSDETPHVDNAGLFNKACILIASVHSLELKDRRDSTLIAYLRIERHGLLCSPGDASL